MTLLLHRPDNPRLVCLGNVHVVAKRLFDPSCRYWFPPLRGGAVVDVSFLYYFPGRDSLSKHSLTPILRMLMHHIKDHEFLLGYQPNKYYRTLKQKTSPVGEVFC
jgi:hypothetical protein